MNNETHNQVVETPSYYAVIPANVRYSTIVSDGAKLLYGEITCLCNKHGYCWASNKYFSELYSKSSDTISRWISELARAGFIFPIVDNANGNSRKIWLSEVVAIGKNEDSLSAKIRRGYRQKSVEGIGKNAEHNNTVNNKSKKVEGKAKKTPHLLGADFESFIKEVDRRVLESEKEKSPQVAPPLPLTWQEQQANASSYYANRWGVRGKSEQHNPILVQSFDGQTLPGSLITTTEVIEQTNQHATAALFTRMGLTPKAANGDEADAILTEWAAENMETIKMKYDRAKRKFTPEDLDKLIIKFTGQYASHSDAGTRERFLFDPSRFFNDKLSGWLIDQPKFERAMPGNPETKKQGTPNAYGGDPLKYKEKQKF